MRFRKFWKIYCGIFILYVLTVFGFMVTAHGLEIKSTRVIVSGFFCMAVNLSCAVYITIKQAELLRNMP